MAYEGLDVLRGEVKDAKDDWDLVTALLGGTSAMRRAGKLYLPQGPQEPNKIYNFRLKVCATLFNGFSKSVEVLAGKPFSEPIKTGTDVPKEWEPYLENIDLESRNLQVFAHEVFKTGVAYGLSHILVDYPESPKALTLYKQKSLGIRPYFCHIKPTQILGWRSEKIAGAETLTQLRILEEAFADDREWGVTKVPQIRVLYPDRYEIYQKLGRNSWTRVDNGPVSLGEIPLVTFYTNRTGFMTGQPPMMDVAHLNKEHWRSTSEQNNILHVARVPILFGAGFDKESEVRVGAQELVTNQAPDSKLAFVEHSGKAIDAGRQSLKDLEEQMRILGAQMLVRDASINKTATEKTIDSAESDSPLALGALSLQDALNSALQFMAKWEKKPTGGSVEVYRDFDEPTSNAAKSDALMKARQEGVVSAQTAFEELQATGVVSETRTWEDELKRFGEEITTGVIGNYLSTIGKGAGVTGQPSAATTTPQPDTKPRSVTRTIERRPEGGFIMRENAA